MDKITEIIPDDMPRWAREAMEKGQLFNEMLNRIKDLERGSTEEHQAINIIFDGPPSPDAGRFVEVETDNGRSIMAGKWRQKDDCWVLRITQLPKPENLQVNRNSRWPSDTDQSKLVNI